MTITRIKILALKYNSVKDYEEYKKCLDKIKQYEPNNLNKIAIMEQQLEIMKNNIDTLSSLIN